MTGGRLAWTGPRGELEWRGPLVSVPGIRIVKFLRSCLRIYTTSENEIKNRLPVVLFEHSVCMGSIRRFNCSSLDF